ncbi:hypothetical protein [Candidatus Accumulibacter sp. ACC003]|uniref:hypothetical protein n=1 Tax=Candidatus Accumulibacter sp. ACC003 TaxID=2823334 RepID=UPI0025C06803|nr:hypothetical protein [Candidatus Accumulibacter sp. ACC003]
MKFPAFFESAPRITVRDPLARFLGASEEGIIEYTYSDAVKLAGHSCPTVAAAYLMTRAAMRVLYPAAFPERGGIRVELREDPLTGVAGVIANVAGLLTGASTDTGFKGIAGRFDRRGLLSFGADIPGQLRFTRQDTNATAIVSARLERLPGDARIASLMPRCVAGTASADQLAQFQSLWQDRVRMLLVEHADDPEIIVVQH